jgi:hypothetical protein
MVTRELNTNLLLGFADGSRDEILVGSLLAAARQSHVTTPRISTALGPTDEEEAIGIGNNNESYSGPGERNVGVGE